MCSSGAHTAKGHAQVLGLDHDPDALGRQVASSQSGDLLGQAFLDLQVSGEQSTTRASLDRPEDPSAG